MNGFINLTIKIIRLPIDIARYILHLPSVKGKMGEHKVAKLLKKLSKENERVINNLTIENKTSSHTHQIDHIFITNKGLFVIETKNYAGRVYGNDNQKEWTQVLNYGKVKNKFYSPVKQNETHIYAIKEILGNISITNIVFFADKYSDYTDSSYVYTKKRFKKYYKSLKENIYTNEEIETMYNTLLENKSLTKNKDHINNIKELKENINNNICPRCGSKLLERTGKYGKFLGCSNYPKCKFIKKQEV